MTLRDKVIAVASYILINISEKHYIYSDNCPYVKELLKEIILQSKPISKFVNYIHEYNISELFQEIANSANIFHPSNTLNYKSTLYNFIRFNRIDDHMDPQIIILCKKLNKFNQSIDQIDLLSNEYYIKLNKLCDVVLKTSYPSFLTFFSDLNDINMFSKPYIYKLFVDLKIVMNKNLIFWNLIKEQVNVFLQDVGLNEINLFDKHRYWPSHISEIYQTIFNRRVEFMTIMYSILEPYYVTIRPNYVINPILVNCMTKLEYIRQLIDSL